MTAEEKHINDIRNWFIEKDGDKFLRLSEKDQNNLVLAVIRTHVDNLKAEK